MLCIIGVDYHPSVQQIAFVEKESGEYGERQLRHGEGETEKFYRDLKQRGASVRVGMEATGHSRWFERLLAELGFELWIASRIAGESLRKDLDGYITTELRITGTVHLAHSARTYGSDDFVGPEFGAQRHFLRSEVQF